tara:strand:- start:7070 stop:7348 length:279 start_codon:yes stop_codon:yes gene_type:complete
MSVPIIKKSKEISKLKEGDEIFIHGKEMIVDKHYLLMNHKDTREMIVEVFNPENEKEYQVRYFDDQVDSSIEVYELVEDFQYIKKEPKSIGW